MLTKESISSVKNLKRSVYLTNNKESGRASKRSEKQVKMAREHSQSQNYTNPFGFATQRPRISSVMTQRSQKPVFRKLAQIVCCEDTNVNSYTCVDKKNSKKTSDQLFKPSDRKNEFGLTHQRLSAVTTMVDSSTSKKLSGPLLTNKCDILGIYIDKAANILRKTQADSRSSSLVGSFKESSDLKNSFDKKIPLKRQHFSVKNSPKKTKNLAARKSIVNLSSLQTYELNPKKQSLVLKSWEANPFSPVKSYLTDRGRNTMTSKVSPFNFESPKKTKTFRVDQTLDACELKEFIELEDYCRRSMVAVTRADTNEDLTKSSFNSSSKGTQKAAEVKPAKKSAFGKKKAKRVDQTSHLVRTMAITISADNKIHYA